MRISDWSSDVCSSDLLPCPWIVGRPHQVGPWSNSSGGCDCGMLDRKPPRSSASAGSHGHRLWAQRPRRRYRHRYPVKRGESSMNAIIKCAVALTGILALAGCAGMEYDDAEMSSASGSSYQRDLHDEYVKLSKSEFDQGDRKSTRLNSSH